VTVRIREFAEDFIVEYDVTTSRHIDKIENYKHVDIYATQQKVMDKYYLAYAVRPRDRQTLDKKPGATQEEAIENLKAAIDERDEKRERVKGNAIVDFNVIFAQQILKDTSETFYAKIESGPKLIIASEEFYDEPELLRSEGFSKSSIRNIKSPEGTTKLPVIPLKATQAQQADIVANGRYILGNEERDNDGHQVFDLTLDSVVDNPKERMFIRKPALTVGTAR